MHYILLILSCLALSSLAATSEFTYQGQLKQNGTPATGSFAMDFKLFDAVTAGTQQGITVSKAGVAVSNGLFVVTLDFGQDVFAGADRFLEVTVGGSALTRQKLTPTPHAIVANTLAAQPKTRVFNSALQVVPHANVTVMTFDSERYDDGDVHSQTMNTSRLTAPKTGVYRIFSTFETPGQGISNGITFVGFRFNNQPEFIATYRVGNDGETKNNALSTEYRLNAGDYVELNVQQTTGGNLSCKCEFGMSLVP